MKHTKGPWVSTDGEISAESKPWPIIGWINQERPTDEDIVIGCGCDDWEANADRIVACVNGCDEAGIENPEVLVEWKEITVRVQKHLRHDCILAADDRMLLASSLAYILEKLA